MSSYKTIEIWMPLTYYRNTDWCHFNPSNSYYLAICVKSLISKRSHFTLFCCIASFVLCKRRYFIGKSLSLYFDFGLSISCVVSFQWENLCFLFVWSLEILMKCCFTLVVTCFYLHRIHRGLPCFSILFWVHTGEWMHLIYGFYS